MKLNTLFLILTLIVIEPTLSQTNTVVVMKTSLGAIEIELYNKEAPITVDNFLTYVREGFYDNTLFHRVINNFMIQGGGYTIDKEEKKTKQPIVNEADNGLKNDIGTIAMARTSDPNSATVQFFINVIDNAFLNFTEKTPQGWGYCVFGKVISGMDVVNKIKAVRSGTEMFKTHRQKVTFQDVPTEPIIIYSIREKGKKSDLSNQEKNASRKKTDIFFPPSLSSMIKFIEPNKNDLLDGGEQANISLKFSNSGKGSAYGLSVKLSPEKISGLTFPSEMFIGEVGAGETKEVSIPISASLDVESKEVSLTLTFSESNGFPPSPVKLTFSTKSFTPPKLEVADVGIEDANGNGRIEVGEVVKVTARIQNTGAGKAADVSASVNIGENIFLTPDSKTSFQLGDMESGKFKDISFSIFANEKATGVPVFVSITEKHKSFGLSNYRLPLELHKTIPKLEEVVVKGKTEEEMKRVELATGLSIDIEQNIPVTQHKNPDAVAVVIGISRYKNPDVPSVDFAKRGSTVMRDYLIKTFGYDERRIIHAEDENASLAKFKQIFEEQLRNYVKPNKSDVFIYYNGHGAPDPETKEAFFVPYDCNPTYAKSTGYPLKEFYNQLAKLPAKSITIVLDACFSGSTPKGMLLKQVSPVFISVENPIMAIDNALLFASSTGQQLSNWYPEKKHGLFTYYFLKALQGNADVNNDKQITVEEIEQYLLNNVPEQARYLNNREQTPQVMARDKQKVLVKY